MLRVGTRFPAFTLPEVRGGQVTLSEVLKERRALILFYRGGWCPLCNRQLAQLGQAYDSLAERGVEVLAISNEPVEKGKDVLNRLGPPFPLLLDEPGDVIGALGLTVESRDPLGWALRKRGYAKPAAALVGQEQRIVWSYVGKNYRDRPTLEMILRGVDARENA